MPLPNPVRDNRKHHLQRDLHKIAIEELAESAMEEGSWFRGNFHVSPAEVDFWRILPRYMIDCLRKPSVMPDSEVEDYIRDAIDKAREAYNNGTR